MPRDADFMLTPEERATRARKRRRRWIIAIAAVVLLAMAAIAARPTRNAIKAWQARRQAEKAFALIEQEKWKEAQATAVAAYQLRATEPEALRALARFLSRVGEPQAFEFWDKLRQHQPLTPADLRDEAGVALALGDRARAEAAIARLITVSDPEPADRLLAAQMEAQQGRSEKAREQLDRVLDADEETEREQLQAALLSLALAPSDPTAPAEKRGRVWERLLHLSQSNSAVGLEALLITAKEAAARVSPAGASTAEAAGPQAGAAIPFPPVVNLADRINIHPFAEPQHKLFALDLRTHGGAVTQQDSIDSAIAQWRESDAAGIGALGAWLNSKGEHQRVIDAIPLDKALQTHDAFLQYVDALGALGRWEEIRQLLDADRFPLDPVIQQMYIARANAQLGNRTAAENSWRRALEAASGDVRKLMTLGEYAEKNGVLDTADAAYAQATSIVPKLRAAWTGRLRAAQRARNTRQMNGVLAGMLEHWPEDAAIQNDEAYTRLLILPNGPAQPELLEIQKLAERLVAAAPTSLPHRTLLALVRLKQGRAADALRVYEGVEVAQNALTPSALAIHAAVLHAAGLPDDAKAKIAQLQADALLPEERAQIAAFAR